MVDNKLTTTIPLSLKDIIYRDSLWDIVKTRRLTSDECVKYILNPDFQLTEDEQKITARDIVRYQRHLQYSDIVDAYTRKIMEKEKSLLFDFMEYISI
jgi:hypothetical protein